MRGIVPWAALGASWTAPGVAVVSRCPARRPPASLEQIQGGIEDGRRGRPSKCGTAAPPHRSKTANGSCPYEDRPGTDGRRPLASKPGAARPWASGFQVRWGSARRCSRGRFCAAPRQTGLGQPDRSKAYRWHVRGRGHPPSTSVTETQQGVSWLAAMCSLRLRINSCLPYSFAFREDVQFSPLGEIVCLPQRALIGWKGWGISP